MGVRDGSGHDATKAEVLDVANHLYFYLVKKYFEGLESGKWGKWDEEADFPRPEFQDHSSRDNAGVFDGFDFNESADQNLINGLGGAKAVEVIGASKTKVIAPRTQSGPRRSRGRRRGAAPPCGGADIRDQRNAGFGDVDMAQHGAR